MQIGLIKTSPIKSYIDDMENAIKEKNFEKARIKIEDIETEIEQFKQNIDDMENDEIEE